MSSEYIDQEDHKVKGLSPAELERSRTWLRAFFDTLREGVHWHREGDEYRAGGQFGLTINPCKGSWYHHATRRGGWSGISLVKFLTYDSTAAATEWLVAFLQEHPGIGTPVAEGNDDHNIESADDTREHLENLIDVAGTPAKTYLRSRGIAGPIPDFIKYRPHARYGENAIAVPLQARDRVVGRHVEEGGKKKYAVILQWGDRAMADRWSDAFVDLVHQQHPGTLDQALDGVHRAARNLYAPEVGR